MNLFRRFAALLVAAAVALVVAAPYTQASSISPPPVTSAAPSGSASGDLSGAYPGATVAKVNGSTVPAGGALTTGNVLQVSGASALSYSPVNLAGGANYVSGTLAAGNGGTGNAFFSVSGPASSTKTFTFPNASANVLTDNAAVTVAQGGTGTNTLAAHGFLVGEGTSAVAATAACTSGQLPIGQGATSDPACETVTGDVAITNAGATTVGAISGTSPISISPNTFQWSSAASPSLTQASESTTTAAGDFGITPQQSTHATDQTGGNFTVNLQTPAGAGTEAFMRIKRGSTEMWRLGSINGSIVGLWAVQTAPSTSNYAIQASVNDTYLNGVNGTHIQLNNSEKILVNSSGVNVAVPIGGDSNQPSQWQASGSQSVTGSSVSLSNAQIMTPVIPLTGTVNASNCTITVPNTVGGHWYFGTSGVTFGGHNLVFTTGSGTSATITGAGTNGRTLLTCVVTASNVVECG